MSRRSYAFLDLAAEPAVGSALLADAPVLLFSADGRRILFANAAGCAFFGETGMAALLERRLSAALPSTETIARFARTVPIGATRLERIRFQNAGRMSNLAARCTHLALPDGEDVVRIDLDGLGAKTAPADRATRLVESLAAEDCLVAILDAHGHTLASAGGFEVLAAGDAAIEPLIGAMASSQERLVKRALRIGSVRRAAAMARFESAGTSGFLMILGPAEPIAIEPTEVPAEAPFAAAPELSPVDVPPTEEDGLPEAGPEPDAPAELAAASGEVPPALADERGTEADDESSAAVAAPDAEAEAAAVPVPADEAEPEVAAPELHAVEPEATAPDVAEPSEVSAETGAEPGVPPVSEPVSEPFRFTQPRGPVRFVFQMDAETRFTFVSPELATIVGPHAADVVGIPWAEVAARRGLDPTGAVAGVLARRDTWSGVTLAWPADGGESVAVDLAALPAFSRDRHFEGYRGFGVIRPMEPRSQPAPPAESSGNVVRLARPAPPPTEERLSPPEQDAFRRIAVVLGADAPVPTREGPKAPPPAAETPPASEPPQPAPPQPEPPKVESIPLADGLDLLNAAEHKIVELESILDTATDGILVLDEEGLIERINRSAEALFGIEAASVAGRPFTDLLAEESRKLALDYLDGLARNGVASVLNDGREVIGRVPQGGLIPLFMTMGRLPLAGRFCAVLRDITQWKNAEEELVNARRAAENASTQKSEFLAKISHEIRTPLNAIIGFSEVMMEERFGPIGSERYKEYLRDIHVSGAHLMSLINDLLDLSKIEAGKLDLAFQAVALNDIVMECVAVMQPQANRERIIIRTSLSGQVPNIVADVRSIRQIVLNLLSNAVKFTLAGGQVIVSTAMEEHGEVTLRIRDTGVGMSEKDIETALKPFRQLATSRERRTDGTGLGLPLTKALVEANRASFSIDSTVGQGTLVRVTFPATRVLAE